MTQTETNTTYQLSDIDRADPFFKDACSAFSLKSGCAHGHFYHISSCLGRATAEKIPTCMDENTRFNEVNQVVVWGREK